MGLEYPLTMTLKLIPVCGFGQTTWFRITRPPPDNASYTDFLMKEAEPGFIDFISMKSQRTETSGYFKFLLHSSNFLFTYLFIYSFMGGLSRVKHSFYEEVRGQFGGVGSLLPPCGFLGSNSDCSCLAAKAWANSQVFLTVVSLFASETARVTLRDSA